jgi:uncharacterized protein (DUF488 family)
MEQAIYTIGHSNHAAEDFLALLRSHGVAAVADVRSAPYSRYNPHYDREALRDTLRAAGLEYAFLGRELGARPDDAACYLRGKVQFGALAATRLFQDGLKRVRQGSERFRVALMCAEKEPLECHRSILVARHLVEAGCAVRHILADGSTESQAEMMGRLMVELGLDMGNANLFFTPEDLMEDAYRMQEARIAFDGSGAATSAA